MSTGDDDVSSGINGRLRPRKSYISSLQKIKSSRRLDPKTSQEKSKRVTTPSKALLNKPDDLSKKSDCTSVIDFLCPYCDKSFVTKQAASKHARRIHFSTSKQDTFINCLYCNHTEAEPNEIVRHMIDSHPNQYFACLDCHTRFPSTTELAEHKINVCERQKLPYRSKLRKKSTRPNKKSHNIERQVVIREEDRHGYNGIVISCELKPTHVHDAADIEDNITTNLILPSSKNLTNKVIDKSAVIVLDDLQWNKRISHNFSFHNTDADQILSRLGVVHRSPRTGESTRKDWIKAIDDASQKFERCFDTSFYSKVASNVQENLSKFLDGSFNFNPDPNHTIKTRKAKNSVPINTVEGFPILLSCEQYSRNLFDGYMPRAIAPKHKWKWDNLENEKNPFSVDIIKRDSHINNCIVTLVSSLDIWTQLCMRRKFEEKFKITPVEKKTEKRNIIGKELKEILESRQLPISTSHSSRNFSSEAPAPVRDGLDFPASLGLAPTVPKYKIQPAVLSGEWVRPRCYVCCACGAQTLDPRALSTHISTQHPIAQVQHYEIAGELINADILKHLYVPPSPVHNRTRPLRGFRECTKCNKSITLEDLHQHMLDCAGDMPAVRRKCRYRQFGVRKRRSRIADNRIRKKIRKEIQRQNGRPRPKIRTEVGDAETIRKMLADLPAKRQRVMINPLNSSLRPRRKIVKQRNQLTLKRRSTEETKSRITNPSTASCGSDRPENNDPNKINKVQEENRSLKSGIKRVQNQGSRRSEIMNKKKLTKTRRKTVRVTPTTENIEEEKESPQIESSSIELSSNKVQIEQLSIQNTPNKVDVNNGPYNTREQANRSNNNGSNNRDNQNNDCNDHNGNSRDQGAPPQNVPLKHSIARLTADYETQDKAVQFHHLFLVQQECNNVTQHVPSGQPVLFENKAVATKLDKPPLNINHRDEPLDNQFTQKGKSSKARKGLNDCIAMLKNKLVEPNDRLVSTAPNVSIQCKIDEPMKPPPVPKTTVNSNRIDITVQCPDTDSSSTDTIITPRRRQSINEKSIEDQIANLPTIGEYIKQNPELLIKHKVYESLSCEVNYQSVESKNQMCSTKVSTSPNTRQSKHPNDVHTAPMKTPKPTKQPQVLESIESQPEKTKPTQKDVLEILKYNNNESARAQAAPMPQTKRTDSSFKANIPLVSSNINTDNIIEKKLNYGKQNIGNIPTGLPIVTNQEVTQKTDVNNLVTETTTSKKDSAGVIPRAHCNSGVESILSAPLDLSGRQYDNDVTAHCSKENTTYETRVCENYETLDLSNKQGFHKDIPVAAPITLNDEVVDLRVKHITTTQTADSSLYSEGNSSNVIAATDLSVRNTEIDCTPTDLSIKGKTKITSIYDIRKEDIIPVDTPYNPDRDANNVCLNLSAKDAEIPTDLSTKSLCVNVIKTNIRDAVENTIYKDSSSSIVNDKNKFINPADLSCRGKQDRQMGILDCNITHPSPEFNTRKSTLPSSHNQTNIERSVYDVHGQQLYPGSSHFNVNRTDTTPKRPFMSPADVTISIMKKHNAFSQSVNKHINMDKPHDDVMNVNKGTYLLGNAHPIITSHSRESTNVGFTSNPGIPLTRRKSENSTISPILPRVAKTVANSDMSLVSSSKIMHESIANTNLYSTDTPNVTLPETASSLPSTSNTDKQKAIDKNIIGYKTKSIPIIEPVINVEIKDKVITSSLEQDPETAKKIAMLPKELVDILGNMPVDHRNQLLNVLPQYVSTSTSPSSNIKSQNDEVKGDSLSYSNLPQYPYSVTHNQQHQHPSVDTFQLQHSTVNYMKSHNIKNTNDTLMDNAQILSRTEKNDNRYTRNDLIVKKRLSDSFLIEDRIIDLTDDKTEPSQTLSPDKENKTSCAPLKPIPPKTNNEKTASLRAVRIKAPSERHKSIIAETQFKKTYQENNNTIKLNNPDKNSQDTLGLLAVQQFEISTTEEAKGINTQSPTALPSVKVDFNINNKRESTNSNFEPIVTDIIVEDDNGSKLCCTSSTMVENVKLLNEISSIPVPPEISPSKSEIITKDDSIHLRPPLNNVDKKMNSLHESQNNFKLNVDEGDNLEKDTYEDDSEDDVSLAIIVKQKLRDQELQNSEKNEVEKIVNEKSENDSVTKNSVTQTERLISNDLINKDTDTIITENAVAYEESKDKHSKEKDRKVKRSRRNINANMTQVVNENIVKNNYDADVNKENTVLCDDTQVSKSDECEQKCLENPTEHLNHVDENLPHENDGMIIQDNEEKVELKDKPNLAQGIDQKFNHEKNNQKMDNGNSNVIENEMKTTNKQSYSTHSKLNTGEIASKIVAVENIESQTKVKKFSQNNSEMYSPVKTLKDFPAEITGSVTFSEVTEKEKQACSDSNPQETNNSLSVKILNLQKDKSITPLRRSRRGKSLFVDNVDISVDIKEHNDNVADQRGPLTKKQLIFSKLLLDGDKSIENETSKIENDTVHQENQNDKATYVSSSVSARSVIKNSEDKNNFTNKTCKRKQSPMTKKKLKRKKSSDKVECIGVDGKLSQKVQEMTDNDKYIRMKESITPELNDDTEKILAERDILPNSVIDEQSFEKSEDINDAIDKTSKPSTVKRKSNNSNSSDIIISSIPKKLKSTIDDEKEPSLNDDFKRNIESKEALGQVETIKRDNKPAARRGRSKSVFVKSSVSELYDPYDINLEDMVPKTVPFPKKGSLKHPIGKKINKSGLTEQIEKKDGTQSTNIIDNSNTNKKPETNIQVESVVETRGVMSDSDDSSKSDIPLKKYVQDKERKKLEVKVQDKNIEESNKTTALRKKNKHSLSVYSNKLGGELCRDENEERIRSEQFMESFGFFSERKPRKSNLLATKKISETFHIIANEKDDTFFHSKDRSSNKKGMQFESRKSADDEGNLRESISSSNKKVSKRGRKKKISAKIEPSFCDVCRKEFHRPDNFLRHQMTLAHVTRVSEADSKVKSDPFRMDGATYLVTFKRQLDRFRRLQDKIKRRKKYCKPLEKIALPTLGDIIADLTTTLKEQQLARRGLSRDEALFLDCCELLNATHKDDGTGRPKPSQRCTNNCFTCSGASIECLNVLEKRINETLEGKCDDGDVDSITAQHILESEEVRNLENDLITGLKEAACANTFNANKISSAYGSETTIVRELNKDICKISENQAEATKAKCKKVFEVKDKMYPDIIENIDMFEDKFDKIKRKCRSQAAKQTQYVETSTSHKSRKKVDKKKRKKSPKKSLHSSVPTKGALKGFDGVKVSISTSEIDMSSILPPSAIALRKKKRGTSKRKRERSYSDISRCDSDDKIKEDPQSKLDVYEFMDNEDAELFEFRPSTLMERFKSIGNKDMPSTSKSQAPYKDQELSSESGSDGDDFVYMSDDYVCSDAETENSLLSCEFGNVKGVPEAKKPFTPPKRKETAEKNAVMGKIFKHNAVRTEKKVIKSKDQVKPKANLDQLFDSLLEEEPNSSILEKNSPSPGHENYDEYNLDSPLADQKVKARSKVDSKSTSMRCYDDQSVDDSDIDSHRKVIRTPSPIPYTSLIASSKKRSSLTPTRKIRSSIDENRPSTSKVHEGKKNVDKEKHHKKSSHRKKNDSHNETDTPKRRNTYSPNYDDDSLLRVDVSLPQTDDSFGYNKRKSKEKEFKIKPTIKASDKSMNSNKFEYNDGMFDNAEDSGVARQRARRKCTVGKQNVLAETWSSESEPDGIPPRPNSADSVVAGVGRKKKGRKKESHALSGRKANNRQALGKKHEVEDSMRSNRSSGDNYARVVPTTRPSAVGVSSKKVRPRPPPYYWSDDEDEPEHVQQHGWIVGDSHKKLVTMLAHAKGKRNNDDKRHLVE
ncbi:uncharacterized protein LOC123705615 isoform X1 [Colias croceus]|uniref:uncharacterized protein LOC123705615 isoform X1 n=1 Tax=Colias crocea TaxID=72248 RepID=UPI001E27A043|nr:uncharacterized protein LOC123705615 isoform X1 [Colias croceus]